MTGIVAAGFSVGKVILSATLNADLTQVATVVYDSVIAYVVTVVAGVMALSLILAIAGAILGLKSTAKLRTWFAHGFAHARKSMDKFGLKTGKFGSALWRNRVAVRVVLVGLAILLVGAAQPLNALEVTATALLLTGLLVGSEVLQRPAVVARRAAAAPCPRHARRRGGALAGGRRSRAGRTAPGPQRRAQRRARRARASSPAPRTSR